MTTTALYRFFDRSGVLLYVGISMNPINRWLAHRGDKPWWSEVFAVRMETYESRREALRAEANAIATELPRYNVAGLPPLPPLPGPFCRYEWGPDRHRLEGRVLRAEGDQLAVQFITPLDESAVCVRWLPAASDRWEFFSEEQIADNPHREALLRIRA